LGSDASDFESFAVRHLTSNSVSRTFGVTSDASGRRSKHSADIADGDRRVWLDVEIVTGSTTRGGHGFEASLKYASSRVAVTASMIEEEASMPVLIAVGGRSDSTDSSWQ
jgi:hypothetical protein